MKPRQPELAGHSPSRSSAAVQLNLLGGFEARSLESIATEIVIRSRRSRALLAFLAIRPDGSETRERLASLLWDDRADAQARQSLRQALLTLRGELGPTADAVLQVTRDRVTLLRSHVASDVAEFALLSQARDLPSLERAVELYKGELLHGLALTSATFSDWLAAERIRLQGVLLRVLQTLVQAFVDEGRGQAALPLSRRMIELDPLREDTHRLLMDLSWRFEGRDAALAHGRTLTALLKKDLGVEPDKRTLRLMEEIRGASPVSSGPPAHGPGSAPAIVVHPARPFAEKRSRPAPLDPPVIPDRLPSIAVLPFRNAGTDPLTDYFGAGLVEDIIVSLGSIGELFVISRGSTLAYRGTDVDPRQVGRELGVAYVVTGSVWRLGERLHVFVELCDSRTGEGLWSDRSKLASAEIFDLQDECVSAFAARIAPEIRNAELRRALRKRPETFTAYDLTLQALDLLHLNTDESYRRAGTLLDQAMAKEPTFAVPHAWASWWRSIGVWQGRAPDRAAYLTEATALARRAMELDPRHALALATHGHLKSTLQHDYDAAEHYLNRALDSCPNSSFAWLMSSFTQSYRGDTVQALARAERALRLSPLDQGRFYYLAAISVAHYSAGRFDEAVHWAELSRREDPTFTATLRYEAAALAAAGRTQEAARVAADLLRSDPTFRLSAYRSPFRDKALKVEHVTRLRHAGIPD